jgi:curved DNA-binding protein
MEYKDYYTILGVSRSAGADEIRSAYRKLAMQYHPDRNQGDNQAEERFKEVNEAYQVLSDPQKRARYDQLGSAYSSYQSRGGAPGGFNWDDWFAQQGAGGNYSGGQVDFNDLFGGAAGAGGFSDFFRAIFGGMPSSQGMESGYGRRRSPSAGYEQPVSISLQEAAAGTTRAYEVQGRRLTVRIPAGAKTGTKVRVAGAAPGGQDLYLKVTVEDDPRYERDGDNLITETTIDVFTALLGGEAEVQTMTKRLKLTIPPGTQPEQKFRIAGQGLPALKHPEQKGDLLVRVKVHIPKNLTPEQKKLLEQAARLPNE